MKDVQVRITAMQFVLEIFKLMTEQEQLELCHTDFKLMIAGAEQVYEFLKGKS